MLTKITNRCINVMKLYVGPSRCSTAALVKSEIPSAKIWEHSLDVLQLFTSYGLLVWRVVVVLTLILEVQETKVFEKWFMRFHQQTHQPWQPDDHPTLESRKELPKHFISWKRGTLHKTYVTVQSILKIKSFQLYTKMPCITLYKTPYKSKSESFKRQWPWWIKLKAMMIMYDMSCK